MAKQVLTISDISPSGNLKKGVIQLPITEARIIASNDIGVKGATDGGTASKDTDPILERTNGATDKSLRLSWASASVIEVQMPPVAYPPDLDDAQPIIVNILAGMKAGSVDAPVITVSAWEGVGDTNMGGDTAALSTALQKLTVALAAADVGAYPKFLTIGLKPGAHATASNDAYVYAAWLEYTRRA